MQTLPDTSAWAAIGCAQRNTYKIDENLVDMRRPKRASDAVMVSAQPQNLIVDLQRAALIVVDMQNDFCAPDGWIGSMGIDVMPALDLAGPINGVTAGLRDAGVPVVWLNWGVRPDRLNLSPGTQHPFNPTGAAPGLAGAMHSDKRDYALLQKDGWGAQIIDDLVQAPSDIHVDKHRISGFWDTPLDAILRNLDVTTLIFAGVNADHCVLGTLMDANFHGYDTVLLEDCTATTSPDFCLQATLHNVRFCFGFTTTSADLLAGLTARKA